MVAARNETTTTVPPGDSIPDSCPQERWTGQVHWTLSRALQPKAGAKVLLFLHGAGHSEKCWFFGPNNLVSYFTRRGHDVIVLSLPGHRPSKGVVFWQTMSGSLKALEAVIADAGLSYEEVVLVGHSMGGIYVQCFLAEHPGLAGAVVVDAPAPHQVLAQFQKFFRRWGPKHPLIALLAAFNSGAMFCTKAQVRELLLGEDAPPALVDALKRTLGPETMRGGGEMRKLAQTRLELPGKKLLYLAVSHSAFFSPADIQASADEYAGATCVTVDGPHNLMMVEFSARQCEQAIEVFLASLTEESVSGGDAC